jgi:mono/diheme cytochrome c family protein
LETYNAARRRRPLLAGLALLSLAAGTACTRIDDALASVPIFAFMRNSPAFDPYEHPLPPAPGSVPYLSPNGPVLPPLAATDQALNAWAAGPWGQNPFAADDQAVLAQGQVMYDRHCAVCHGVAGTGDGPMFGQGRFPLMPSLIAPPATGLSDGYVYGVIRAGRGLMPGYGARMTHDERWAIVVYVNALQAAAGVAPQPAPQPEPEPAADAGGASPELVPGAPAGAGAATDTVPSQQ